MSPTGVTETVYSDPQIHPVAQQRDKDQRDNLAFCLLQKGPREEQLSSPRLKAAQILPVRVGSGTLNMQKLELGATVPELRWKQRLWKADQVHRCQKLLPHRPWGSIRCHHPA